jgi:hypothetical protein
MTIAGTSGKRTPESPFANVSTSFFKVLDQRRKRLWHRSTSCGRAVASRRNRLRTRAAAYSMARIRLAISSKSGENSRLPRDQRHHEQPRLSQRHVLDASSPVPVGPKEGSAEIGQIQLRCIQIDAGGNRHVVDVPPRPGRRVVNQERRCEKAGLPPARIGLGYP